MPMTWAKERQRRREMLRHERWQMDLIFNLAAFALFAVIALLIIF